MEDSNETRNYDNLEKTTDVEVQQIISLNKFIFLSIISFGAYELWWIYKAWRFFMQKDKLDIMPAVRTIFSLFFLNSLFDMILNFAKRTGYKARYSSTTLVILFFITNFLSKLPDPFWLIAVFSFVFIIPPFKALNFAKQNATNIIVDEETSFSGRQIALIIVGAIFWVLVVVGMANE